MFGHRLALAALITAACSGGSSSQQPRAPQALIEAKTVAIPALGELFGLVPSGSQLIAFGAGGLVVVGQQQPPTPWPAGVAGRMVLAQGAGGQARLVASGDATHPVTILNTDATVLATYDPSPLVVNTVNIIDLDHDGQDELIITYDATDEIHAVSLAGVELWAERWGADVASFVAIPGPHKRLAHTEGIGLIVRNDSGEILGRARPTGGGHVFDVEIVYDIADFAGPTIAVSHQSPGGVAKVDLYAPTGTASRGTLTPLRVMPYRLGAALGEPDNALKVVPLVTNARTVTVYVVDGERQTVWSEVLPTPHASAVAVSHEGSAYVASASTLRRYSLPTP